MDKIIRFSVSLPEKLLEELDKKVDAQGYASRSEFTRDLIREKIVKDDWQDDNSDVIGVLTMIYTHHDTKVNIMCNTHVRVSHEHCLEPIMVKGKVSEVKDFAQKIAGLKGVKFSKLVEASVPAS